MGLFDIKKQDRLVSTLSLEKLDQRISEKKDEIRKYFEESYRIFLDFCEKKCYHYC